MTAGWLSFAAVVCAAICSLYFSSLSYALRAFSRVKLSEQLERAGRSDWLEQTVEHAPDLIFVTAVVRLFANLFVFVGVLHLMQLTGLGAAAVYSLAILLTFIVTLFASVAIPHAVAEHASEPLIAVSVRFLHGMRVVMLPVTHVMHAADRFVRNLAGAPEEQPQTGEQLQADILEVVEEGEKEGVVDEQEREMIESVIQFRDTHVGQAMTGRADIVGLPITSSLHHVKNVIEQSGHSRIPAYDGTLDHIVGVLYARDLLRYLGDPPAKFDIRTVIRPAFYVPETRALRDLLKEFRDQKMHIAIVLDEYGGTAGLVTIEDVLEELVGDISDEHEPGDAALLKRIDARTSEADARIYIEQVNRMLQITLPEDAGYETLGGFVSTTLGRIPENGASFEHNGVRFTILDAVPQRVNRVKIEILNPVTVPSSSVSS
ncbi:MAG: hemolysin family protein [Tepidisphaeraceae bacterium]